MHYVNGKRHPKKKMLIVKYPEKVFINLTLHSNFELHSTINVKFFSINYTLQLFTSYKN